LNSHHHQQQKPKKKKTHSSSRSVSVPATSANMGPGFDSFGFAVDLKNELVLERGAFQIEIFGEGELSLPKDETNAIIGAVRDGYAAIFPNEGAGLSHFLTLRHD